MCGMQYQDLRDIQQKHQERLYILEKQAALLGIETSPSILIEIDEIQRKIAELDGQLGLAALPLSYAAVADFVGREHEIEQLVQSLSRVSNQGALAVINGIRGMGGVGKTELAYAVAQRLAIHFPDGQFLVELQGMNDPISPEQALKKIILAVNRNIKLSENIKELQVLYRSALAGKRILILADDAKDAMQVKPLQVPPGCALLITSRQRFVIPGMNALDLDTLPVESAVQLLLTICPRIGKYAKKLASMCGCLPLALRVVAGILVNDKTLHVGQYLTRLANNKISLLRDPDDPQMDVNATLELSYETLKPIEQAVLCNISVFPGSFSIYDVDGIINLFWDSNASIEQVFYKNKAILEEILSLLYRRCILDYDEEQRRYILHDLIREFAQNRLPYREHVQERYRNYIESRRIKHAPRAHCLNNWGEIRCPDISNPRCYGRCWGADKPPTN